VKDLTVFPDTFSEARGAEVEREDQSVSHRSLLW